MSSVPAVYLSLDVVERDHRVHVVRVVERQAGIASLLRVQVIGVVYGRRRRHDVFDQVQQTTRNEPVAVFSMYHRYGPRLLNRQVIGVQLGHEQRAAFIVVGVDRPESVLIDGQVEETVLRLVEVIFAL